MDSIVVTGIGLSTPLSSTREGTWSKVKSGKSLMQEPLCAFAEESLRPYIRQLPVEFKNNQPRIYSIAHATVEEALEQSGIQLKKIPSEKIGCMVSVSKPILQTPWSVLPPDSLGKYLCRNFEITGPSLNLVAACATGIFSLNTAVAFLQNNECDIMIAGSVESSLHPLYVSGFKNMRVLSDHPCPFDKKRRGFMIGEGAGIFILERKKDAQARGAKIIAEISSCALGSDSNYPAEFSKDGSSIARVLKRAVSKCGPIQYVNAHGTGTRLNDVAETRAIRSVFGKEASSISISSTKASTGHLLGASGSVEAAFCCLALRDQFVPPTLNLETPDPECDLDYTPLKGKNCKMNTAVSLSFGFGGSIGVVVFKI